MFGNTWIRSGRTDKMYRYAWIISGQAGKMSGHECSITSGVEYTSLNIQREYLGCMYGVKI